MLTTQDITKGHRVRLRNGWQADVLDNQRKANTRLCRVYGICEDMGSVYSTDIEAVLIDGEWKPITLTAKQVKQQTERAKFGF